MNRLMCMVTIASIAVMGTVAQADVTSYFLDQSNTFADGVNYGQVTVTTDSTTGQVDFLVDAFVVPDYGTPGTNFGIQTFGFNFSGTSTLSFTLPTGWTDSTGQNQDGFGNFNYVVSGTGSTRQDPLAFSILLSNPAEAIASSFEVLSGGTAGQGNVFFAAHVAGFNDGSTDERATSHFIGGSTAIPAPAALVLCTMGLGLVSWAKRRLA